MTVEREVAKNISKMFSVNKAQLRTNQQNKHKINL